jgi:hypothetical protein
MEPKGQGEMEPKEKWSEGTEGTSGESGQYSWIIVGEV